MNNPNFDHVMAFLKVVETGGFMAAARELRVTQSTVSRRISELERVLGCKLIERTTRRLFLTETGRHYAERVRLPMQNLAEAAVGLSQDQIGIQGPIKITIPTGYGRHKVLSALGAFARQNPAIQLDVDLSDRYVDILQDGFDFAIRMNEPLSPGLDVQPIAKTIKIHLCATPDFLKTGTIRTLEDLAKAPCIVQRTYAPRTVWNVYFDKQLHPLNINPKMVLSSADAVYEMTLQGMGIGVLPDFLVDKDLQAGSLMLVSERMSLSPVRFFMVWPSHKAGVVRIQALHKHLSTCLAN